MSIELKVKIKSLTEESRIIRKEEYKLKEERNFSKLNDLHLHRVMHIRPEARATYLAYGLLRGLDYHEIERTTKTIPEWHRVKAMVKKYSDSDKLDDNLEILERWKLGTAMYVPKAA